MCLQAGNPRSRGATSCVLVSLSLLLRIQFSLEVFWGPESLKIQLTCTTFWFSCFLPPLILFGSSSTPVLEFLTEPRSFFSSLFPGASKARGKNVREGVVLVLHSHSILRCNLLYLGTRIHLLHCRSWR